MSRALVDIILTEIKTQSQGHVTLDTVMTGTIAKDVSSSKAKTINRRRRAIGTVSGTPDFSVELECWEEKGGNQIDWDFLWETREECTLFYELADGGLRRSTSGCTVDKVSRATSESGESKLSISIAGIDDKSEQ